MISYSQILSFGPIFFALFLFLPQWLLSTVKVNTMEHTPDKLIASVLWLTNSQKARNVSSPGSRENAGSSLSRQSRVPQWMAHSFSCSTSLQPSGPATSNFSLSSVFTSPPLPCVQVFLCLLLTRLWMWFPAEPADNLGCCFRLQRLCHGK